MNFPARMVIAQEHSWQDRNRIFFIVDMDEASSTAKARDILINIVCKSLVPDAR